MGQSVGDVVTSQRSADEGELSTVRFETKTSIKASFLGIGYRLASMEKGVLMQGRLIRYSRKGQENGRPIDIEGRLENKAFRFEIRDHGATRMVVILRSSYDYTDIDCPEARIDFAGNPQVSLRILDLEKLAVVTREYNLVRNGHYSVGGKEYPCRVVDFSDRHRKARRWITQDGPAVVMYRQDSRIENNEYSIQATSLTREL